MTLKIPYKGLTDRERILNENEKLGNVFSGEMNIVEGDFLLFNGVEKGEPSIEERLAIAEDTINFLLGL